MSSNSCPSSKRPLRRGRLPADVYPQDPKQCEDELSAETLKKGFTYSLIPPEHEHGSIKSANLSTAVVSNYFSALLVKKEELSVQQETNRKRPILNNKDQFFAVTKPNSKPFLDSFFKELVISKPVQPLPKKIPVFNKKEDAIQAMCENNVPFVKAAWYLKIAAAHSSSLQETKQKKRQIADPAMEWTVAILICLNVLLKKMAEYYRLTTPDKNDAVALLAATLAPPGERQDYETLTRHWKYNFGLMQHLYDEGLLDRQEVCTWLVRETTDKARSLSERGLLKLVVPNLLPFVQDILTSVILSRKLAATCARYLAGVCQSPKAGPPGVTKSPLRLIEEALECSHHSVPVRGLIGILQLIVIENPAACLWIALGEERASSQIDGSPLDFLPVCPSDLPVSQTVAVLYPDFKERIKKSEEEIRNRSILVESKWLSPKTTSETVGHVAMCLHALEALDRQTFHRQDPPDTSDKFDMESLHASVFKSAPRDLTSETWRNDIEPLIFFLCRWSISTRRAGIHRGMMIACLLEKFQSELAVNLPSLDSASASHFVFQDLLMKFLDEEGPKFDSSGKPHDLAMLESTVLLFAELISRNVFSHDAYVCALISSGLIPQAPIQRQPAQFYNQRPAASPMSQIDSNYFMQPSPASTSGSMNSYEMQPPPVNYGVFAGASGEEYLRKNAIPQSPGSYGGYERKPVSMMSPYQVPSHHVMPQFQRPSQPHPPQPHPFYAASPAPSSADFPTMDSYDQPGSVSSVLSDAPFPSMSPHYYYVLHFPISHGKDGGHSSHELNQRAILLYGFGQTREQARVTTKGVTKDTEKLFGRKFCYEIKDGRMPSKTSNYSNLRERFLQLSFFDRHLVSEAAVKVLMKRLSAILSGSSDYLPTPDSIQFAMELLEKALNIQSILDTAKGILDILRPLRENPVLIGKRGFFFVEAMQSPVMLICVSLLRKYHSNLLLSPRQTIVTFKTLRESVLNVSNPACCTSAERCVLAYIYDLFLSAGFLKNEYEEFEKGAKNSPCEQIRNSIMAKIPKLTTSYFVWRKDFMVSILNDPARVTKRPSAEVIKQLTLVNSIDSDSARETAGLQRSFVVNALYAVANEHDLTKVNNIAIFCAEMTASCNGLTMEWIMALHTLVYSKLCPRVNLNLMTADMQNVLRHYTDHLAVFDITDRTFHERLALFCRVLVARHAIRLEILILNVAMMVLMMANKCMCLEHEEQHWESSQVAGRLVTHIMVRLLHGPEAEWTASYHGHVWDRSLLTSVRKGLALAPLLATLKCMLVLSDSDADAAYSRDRSRSPEVQEQCSYGWNVEKVGDFARMALLDICQEESVRDCFLRGLEMVFSQEMLLDRFIKPHQTRFLLHLLSLPRQQALAYCEEPLESDKYTTCIQRILHSLDQWNVRSCYVEVHLIYSLQASEKSERERREPKNPKDKDPKDREVDLLDIFAKSVIDAFQQRMEDKTTGIGSAQSKRGRMRSFVLDTGDHVWYIAPLVAKLDPKVQEKVLKHIIHQLLDKESCAWTIKQRDQEKLKKSTILLGNAPFMAVVRTCLSQPDRQAEQKENLLRKMLEQLSQFATEYVTLSTAPGDGREVARRHRPLLMEALALRLSLAGNLLDLIQAQPNHLADWACLLTLLITTGCVEPVESQELFDGVFDFLTVLVHTALAYDQPTAAGAATSSDKPDDRKLYTNLVKKMRKECGAKLIAGVEWVKMLLPFVPCKVDVIAVEPIGTVTDAKGNKTIPPVPFESADRKHGLQVESKESLDPWEVIEGFRIPTALPWTFFNAVKADKKMLTAEYISHLMAWHTHTAPKPAEYFLEPPPVPAEEDLPERTPGGADEPANSETASVDTASPRSPRGSRQPAKGKKPPAQTSKKRASRSPASVQPQFLPSQPVPMGYVDGGGMMGQAPAWYNQPQPPPQGQGRFGYPGHPGGYPMQQQAPPQHIDLNRQRMQPDQRPQARPHLQNMLQARHAASQPQGAGYPHQQSAHPQLNHLLTNHQQPQQQRTNIQQLHLQSGPNTGVGGMMQAGPSGTGGHHPGNMAYGTMRPPQPLQAAGLMPDAAAEYAMKQQQHQQMRMRQQQQMAEMRNFQPQPGGGGAGGPYGQQQPGQMVSGDGSQGQPLYVTDQQQSGGGMSYLTEQQQQQQQHQAMYRQNNPNMAQEYLQQQYQHQQQQQQQQRGLPRQ